MIFPIRHLNPARLLVKNIIISEEGRRVMGVYMDQNSTAFRLYPSLNHLTEILQGKTTLNNLISPKTTLFKANSNLIL
jgi:hypothetical protein